MSEGEKPTEQDITLWTKEAADDIMAASEPRDPPSDESEDGREASSVMSRDTVATAPGQTLASRAPPPQASIEGHPAAGGRNKLGDPASAMKDTAAEYGGRIAEQVSDYIHKQPLAALTITGVVCLAIGVMLGRH